MYPLPNPDSEPYDVAAGPDGNLWSPYHGGGTVARITPNGSVKEFSFAGSYFVFPRITAGADGNLWLLDLGANAVDRITPDGASITKYKFSGEGGVGDITRGPDGNIWFTEINTPGAIGRATPSGAITEFVPGGNPGDIVAGPDANLWYTEQTLRQIGKMTPDGVVVGRYDTPSVGEGGPYEIARGPDANLWYTKPEAGTIGRVTTAGVVTEFVLPVGVRPGHITTGPDANLWFTDRDTKQIGRITPAGQVGLFTPSSTGYWPGNITTGPDGRLWFSMRGPARIGAFSPFAPPASPPDVRALSPRSSRPEGGTKVLITGYNVGAATKVLFGSTSASFKVVGPGQIEAVAPARPVGQVDVTVFVGKTKTAPSAATKFFYESPQCGQVVTASTTLQSDIGPCYGNGMIVGADSIVVDLGGHAIRGFPGPADGDSAGIRLPQRVGVTVTNGTVTGFDAGMVVRGGGSNTLRGLTITDNVGPDDVFSATLGDGIFIEDSASNQVVGNTISRNGIFDGIGVYGAQANANTIENNLIENTVGSSDGGPAGQGIIINGASGTLPTAVLSNRVVNNVVRNNASAGISNINHVAGSILNNRVEGNGRTNSVGNGIGIQVGPFFSAAAEMLIQGNEVHGNGVDGIRIGPRASGNHILDNDAGCGPDDPVGCVDNNANPAANGYENQTKGFDLHDLNVDCAGNRWSGNTWGTAYYAPDCTAAGGNGPAPTVAVAQAESSSPAASDFPVRGRRRAPAP